MSSTLWVKVFELLFFFLSTGRNKLNYMSDLFTLLLRFVIFKRQRRKLMSDHTRMLDHLDLLRAKEVLGSLFGFVTREMWRFKGSSHVEVSYVAAFSWI